MLPLDTRVPVGVQSSIGLSENLELSPDLVHSQDWGSARGISAEIQFGVRVEFRVMTSAWHRGSARTRVQLGSGLSASAHFFLLQDLPPQTSDGQTCVWAEAESDAISNSVSLLLSRGL